MLNRRLWLNSILLVVLSGVAIYVWSPRWRSFPAISHPEADRLLRQLYTACSARDAERLSVARERFNSLKNNKAITDAEQAAFEKIFKLAESQTWDVAARHCLNFAKDQIGRSRSEKHQR